jgi:hypothetical protein
MSRELKTQVLSTAGQLADQEHEIAPEDRRDVVFCAISDLESLLAKANEETFLRAMIAASDERFRGWMLEAVHDEIKGEAIERKPFPFGLGEVLPWWEGTEQMQRNNKKNAEALAG